MWSLFRRRPPIVPAPLPPPAPQPEYALDVAICSDVGQTRAHNEDRGQSVRPGDAATRAAKGVLVLVADGMGGHAAGEVASTAAAEIIAQTYYASTAPPPDALRAAFLAANAAIHARASADAALDGMGTTCTALVLRGGEAWAAHVGDSRLYRCRDGRSERLTEDHSVVSEMVREGLLTEAQARNHEQRNVITRALGIHAHVEPTVRSAPLAVRPGDVFLLSSDGLYDLVEEDEIAQAVASGSVHDAAQRLVDLANARGGFDNVTVGVVRVRTAEADRAAVRATREAPAAS